MKKIIICCNYNEEKTNNLKDCLRSLAKIKDKDTIIGFIDNKSIDHSRDIISEYMSFGVIDYCIFAKENLGKAKALSSLFLSIINAQKLIDPIRKLDIVIHLDSDITLHKNFLIDAERFLSSGSNILYTSELSLTKNKFTQSSYHTFNRTASIFEITEDNRKFLTYYKNTKGICGCSIAMRVGDFLRVGMYDLHLGKNKTSAIYGGDDAVLLFKLNHEFPHLNTIISVSDWNVHPETKDKAYQDWKNMVNQTMAKGGFGNSMIPDKGFYDN